ncbi:hypothetical protein L3Q82_007263 [Scortum barcoo]|uniref:Uncharacterized protein n=1 Tax=Scortum barcoo TaxID=214431 RepID=A0ACB8WSK6_9TELE|nr:hypothetical protein L3Q82_007263 [Scortum barcoo]
MMMVTVMMIGVREARILLCVGCDRPRIMCVGRAPGSPLRRQRTTTAPPPDRRHHPSAGDDEVRHRIGKRPTSAVGGMMCSQGFPPPHHKHTHTHKSHQGVHVPDNKGGEEDEEEEEVHVRELSRKRQEKTVQMMADHGDPCDGQEAAYCMNGGTCYKILSMNTLSCVCNENYKGSRCEHFQLFSISANAGEAGLIAAVVIIAILIFIVLAVVIYYICKMLKAKQQSQQNKQQQYWRVKPRV